MHMQQYKGIRTGTRPGQPDTGLLGANVSLISFSLDFAQELVFPEWSQNVRLRIVKITSLQC